ncbi:MAG TPA: lamin tail domain-containing protein [Bacteroidales bacterium]|nr:lamin tail domain-containing protein [Bacteroidales bacterium]
MKQYISLYSGLPLLAILFFLTPSHAQTVLLPGDLVITGFNMDNPDEVSLAFLVAIEAGTEIRLTDNGWKASGTFRTGEGTDIWIATADHPAGAEVVVTISGMALSSSGDQILVYQGTEETPLFVAAINDEGEHIWQEDATDASTSALPAGLVNGVSCVALAETDNLVYNRSLINGSQEELQEAVNNYLSWTGSDTQRQVLSTGGFTVVGEEVQPAGLQILSVNGGIDPFVDAPFYVSIQTVDSSGNICPVGENTVIGLSVATGTGQLYGNLQDTLFAGGSSVVITGIRYDTSGNNITLAALVLTGTMLEADTSSPFNVLPLARIVIHEIHYNGPETGTDTSEFIELVNAGSPETALGGYTFTQGVTFTFPDTATLGPGEFVVVAYSSGMYQDLDSRVYEWQSGTLSNSGETIELQNAAGQLIDLVTYSDDPAWGNRAPDGYGPSLELIGQNADNSFSGNWKASHMNGGTPGQANSLAPVAATWAGGCTEQEHNWAVPSNWLAGQSAGAGTQVTVPASVNALLIIDHPFFCQDLSLAPGAMVTVAQGDTLRVGGSLWLQADTSLTSSLLLEDDLAAVEVSGTSIMEVFLSGGISRDPEGAVYHFISPPVTQAQAGDVFPGSAFVRQYNEPLQLWENLTFSSPLSPVKGYSVWLEGGSTMVDFSGEFNSGVQQAGGLSYTGPGLPSYQPDYAGYQLIGNPFPSAINWEHPAILRDHIQNAIYFWNPEREGYSSYINGVGNNPETTDSIVPAMQGFFIRVDAPGQTGSVTFTNAARLHEVSNHYLPVASSFPLFRINVSGEDGTDQTTLCFREGSTSGFDLEYDAHKLFGNDGVPQVYSFADDGSILSVNAFPSVTDTEHVMIGFTAYLSGMYVLAFTGMETFPAGMDILLEDLKEDVLIDCRDHTDYSFSYAPGDDPERFLVHFTVVSGHEEITSEHLVLCRSGNHLHLMIPSSFREGELFVHDMTGRLVRRESVTHAGLTVVTVPESKGWYIVRVLSSSGVISQKVFIP